MHGNMKHINQSTRSPVVFLDYNDDDGHDDHDDLDDVDDHDDDVDDHPVMYNVYNHFVIPLQSITCC